MRPMKYCVNTAPAARLVLVVAGAAVFAGSGIFSPATSHAQAKKAAPAAAAAAAPATVPDAPKFPAAVPFDDELAGRRLLYDARDTFRRASAVRFAADFRSLTDDNAQAYRGVESVSAELGKQRLAVTTEFAGRAPGKPIAVRRAVAANASLLATKFQDNGSKPAREFVRLPLAPGDPLPHALAQVQFAPVTKAAGLLLDPRWTVRGTTYRVSGTSDVLEQEARGEGRDERQIVRRYRIDPKTRLLTRFEEWTTARLTADERRRLQQQEQQRRQQARQRRQPLPPAREIPVSRVTYRREDYRNASAGAGPLPGSLFAQTLPAGYVETALPSVNLPLPDTGPDQADPRAMALMDRWQQAHDRLLSYYAEVDLSLKVEPKTADARPMPERFQGQQMRYTAWLRKPDKARLTMTNPSPLPGRGPINMVGVSDGTSVAVQGGGRGDRTRAIRIGETHFGQRLTQAGWRDQGQAFDWLLFGPRVLLGNAERIAYLGEQMVDGVSVDVVEMTSTYTDRDTDGRRRRGSSTGVTETTNTVTVYLSRADGLPRRIERSRGTEVEGMFDRDEPPNTLLSARYRITRVDVEPPADVFALPQETAAGGQRRR